MEYVAVNLRDKLSGFSDRWSPEVVAEMNDYQFKLAKVEGDFVWHDHKETGHESTPMGRRSLSVSDRVRVHDTADARHPRGHGR